MPDKVHTAPSHAGLPGCGQGELRAGGPQLLLGALAAGLVAAPFLPASSPFFLLLPSGFGLAWLLLARRRRWAILFLAAFFASLGPPLYHAHLSPPAGAGFPVSAFAGEAPRVVEGTVLAVEGRDDGRWNLDLDANRVGGPQILAPTRGRLRVYLRAGRPAVSPGDEVRFLGRIRVPRPFGTPGEFDWPRHLASQGIYATATVESSADLVRFARRQNSLSSLAGRAREGIGRLIEARLDPPGAALVKALVIGERGGLSPEQREVLARGGIAHLFAISGLHLGLAAALAGGALLFIWRRSERLLLAAPPRRFLPLAVVPLLAAYLLLTGSALSARRTFLMALAGAILLLLGRRSRPLDILHAAVLILLLADPLSLFAPSLQLSYAGVLGLMALLPRWLPALRPMHPVLRWPGGVLATTLAASIATFPLVLMHFHLAAPAGLAANLLAVPAVGLTALPLGIAGTITAPVWPEGAGWLFQGCGATLQLIFQMVRNMVAVPCLAGWKLYLSPLQTAGAFGAAAALLAPGGTPFGRRGRLAGLFGGLALLAWPGATSGSFQVTALSVGQGESVLLSRGDGRHYLVDGGGLPSETFDVGERLVAPALGRLGVRSLEAVILTHPHPDHWQGLVAILRDFPVRSFWSAVPLDRLEPSIQDLLRQKGIPLVRFPSGWTVVEARPAAELAVFVPPVSAESANDRSLILYCRQGGNGVLLTGDIENQGVAELLRAWRPVPANLLKLPHHGSRRSCPPELLDRLRPELAFASCGFGNRYRFPHPEVLAALDRRAVPLFRTDLQGALRFTAAGGGWRAETWQSGLFR